MLKNYLIVAWRNIKKSKAYSALNIIGLAVGMAVFILIMLFVRTELSYDRYHANAGNIYRVIKEDPGDYYLGSNVFAVTPGPLAPALVRDLPEVRNATRIGNSSNVLISVGEKHFVEKSLHWADPRPSRSSHSPSSPETGPRPWGIPFPRSYPSGRAAALRRGDPINRTIVYHTSEDRFEFKVAGVFRDIPSNSHFIMDIVAPFETMGKVQKNDLTQWGNSSYYTYILLKDGADPEALDAKLPAFYQKYAAGSAWWDSRSLFFLSP